MPPDTALVIAGVPILQAEPHPCDLYHELRSLFDSFNWHLFDRQLPPCMIVLRAQRGALGYFQETCWGQFHHDEAGVYDAIALNTTTFPQRTTEQIASTLVHEMVHLWQRYAGEQYPKHPTHNREWAQKMVALGLQPSHTGLPGGKATGRAMGHFILDGGEFQKVYAFLGTTDHPPLLSWQETPKLEPVKKQAKKYKFICPSCETKAWAYEGTTLRCGECGEALITAARQLPLLGMELEL